MVNDNKKYVNDKPSITLCTSKSNKNKALFLNDDINYNVVLSRNRTATATGTRRGRGSISKVRNSYNVNNKQYKE